MVYACCYQMPPAIAHYRILSVIFLNNTLFALSSSLRSILPLVFVAADMMITLLSKGLQLHKYFHADDETTVAQVLLSCVRVSYSLSSNPLKCCGNYNYHT